WSGAPRAPHRATSARCHASSPEPSDPLPWPDLTPRGRRMRLAPRSKTKVLGGSVMDRELNRRQTLIGLAAGAGALVTAETALAQGKYKESPAPAELVKAGQ